MGLGTQVRGSTEALIATQRNSVHRFQRPGLTQATYDSTITMMGGWGSEGSFQKIAGDWYGGLTFGTRWSGEARINAQFRNLWGTSLSVERWRRSLSPWELRGGPALMGVANTEADLTVNTDRRKTVSGELSSHLYYAEETAERRVSVAPGIRLRPSSAVSISIAPRASWNRDEDQYIRTVTVNGERHYLLGHLDQTTASLTARIGYAVTPDLALDIYAQPFLSSGHYPIIREAIAPGAPRFRDRYATLGPDRLTFDAASNRYSTDVDRDGRADFSFTNPDFSARQFRANTVVRWQYRPGSTLYLVWSQARDDGSLAAGMPVRRELDRLFTVDPRNIFLLKVSYWMGQ